VLIGEATNTNCIFFGLTQPIYRTGGEHANRYTTAAVKIKYK